MDTESKNLLFVALIKTSIDCIDEAQEEDTEIIKIPKATYDCFKEVVNNMRLEIAKANGLTVLYNETTGEFYYGKER